VGSHPGIAYFNQNSTGNLGYFADVLEWAGKTQQVSLSNPALQARLHQGADGKVLWVLNSTREAQTVKVSLGASPASFGAGYWIGRGASVSGDSLTVPPRDAVVEKGGSSAAAESGASLQRPSGCILRCRRHGAVSVRFALRGRVRIWRGLHGRQSQ
jgi:hypothetical protein